jgi:hypothetical protein
LIFFHLGIRPALTAIKGGNMELQKTILKQYLLLSQEPTLREISKVTGIQQTRVFRLLNGSEMKLSEYEIFHQHIKEKLGATSELEVLAGKCSQNLSLESIREIENFMSRKLAVWNLKQEINKSEHKQSIA